MSDRMMARDTARNAGIAVVVGVLLVAVAATAEAGSRVQLRLQAVAGQLPGAPAVPCPLQQNTWAAFLVKQIQPGGAPVDIDVAVAPALQANASNCFFESDSLLVPQGQVRVVGTDGAIVRRCTVDLTEDSSAGVMIVTLRFETNDSCAVQFVKAGG